MACDTLPLFHFATSPSSRNWTETFAKPATIAAAAVAAAFNCKAFRKASKAFSSGSAPRRCLPACQAYGNSLTLHIWQQRGREDCRREAEEEVDVV